MVQRLLVFGLVVTAGWAQPASAQSAGAKPAATAKKATPTGKAKTPEYHGEATPRNVVPGSQVLVALMELGTQKMAAGRYEEALKAFSDAIGRDPMLPKPLYLRGACYQKMNRLREAEADFRAALDKDHSNVDEQTYKVRAELGAVLTDSGRAAEAIEVLEQAVKAKPDLFEAQYNLGVAHEAMKHWAESIAAYTRATKLKPADANPRADQADAQLNLAVVLRRAGKTEEAIVPAREAVQLASDRPHPHLNLGLLLSDAKRYDEAVAELTAATQLAEEQFKSAKSADEKEDGRQMLIKGYWRLGVVHIRREQAAPAVQALERAKTIEATPEILTDLGLARRKAGDIPRAEQEFRAALQKNPKMQSARLHLASTLATTGRCEEGLKELTLVSPDPQLTETINRIKARCDYEKEMKRRGLKPQ